VVGIPDALKGQMPFAFVSTSGDALSDDRLLAELQQLVRRQVGAIATLGGMIQGPGMVPKTRSGKTLRRVLRELVENAVHGEFDRAVSVPSTVEDASVVDVARAKVRAYFEEKGERHKSIEGRAKL
jgi:propionyl-CoA synthetase